MTTAGSGTPHRADESRSVVVVGGGPAGLLVAGIVAGAGVPVVALEAAREPARQTRASTLHARTMEVLDDHGVPGLSELPCGFRGHFGGIPLDLETAPSPWAGTWRCPQPELVDRLGAWAADRGADVRRGEPVAAVVQDDDHASVRTASGQSLSAGIVVAADGANGVVRHQLGVDLDGPGPTRSMVRADVVGAVAPRRFQRIGPLTLTAAPLDRTTTRVMLHDPSWSVGEYVSASRLRETWAGATGELLPEQITWIDTFDDATAWAEQVVVGRVALCGDAARRFVPIGGAALNHGLVDAARLAEAVVERVRDGRTAALERHALDSVRGSAEAADRLVRQARLIFGLGDAVAAERRLLTERIVEDPALHADLVRQVSGLAPGPVPVLALGAGR